MGKRGLSQRERAVTAVALQSSTHKSIIDKITQYLNQHPEQAGTTWEMLQAGLMDPSVQATSTLKQWLPDSNSQIRFVAAYFLAAFLTAMDERLRDPHVVEALQKATTDEYDATQTPKDQRYSWAHRLFCRITGAEVCDRVPSRFKPRFVSLYRERVGKLGRSLEKLPLTVSPGRRISLNYEIHGIYTKSEEDEHGRFLSAEHCDGHKVPPSVLKHQIPAIAHGIAALAHPRPATVHVIAIANGIPWIANGIPAIAHAIAIWH